VVKSRLDIELARRGLVTTRSQGESYIKLGKVKVNGKFIKKSGFLVSETNEIELLQSEQYVSRAALKLASAADKLGLDFKDKIILDVGSSTGGFTDYALKRGAIRVIAVDVGSDQLHPSLRGNPKVEVHEKTDIRDFATEEKLNMVLIDASFISLRQILPAVAKLSTKDTRIVAMLKPQFEAGANEVNPSTSSGFRAKSLNKGVIKNDSIRRQILKDFELWAKNDFFVKAKADSEVSGAKGNLERFYLLYKS
jgi:23S rRNA (cytidine1920-2'-O)/16S rRNA (cytidine1409-2'-O)-methyltransferase